MVVPISVSAVARIMFDTLPSPIQVCAASRKSLSEAIVPPLSEANDIASRTASITDADEIGFPFSRWYFASRIR